MLTLSMLRTNNSIFGMLYTEACICIQILRIIASACNFLLLVISVSVFSVDVHNLRQNIRQLIQERKPFPNSLTWGHRNRGSCERKDAFLCLCLPCFLWRAILGTKRPAPLPTTFGKADCIKCNPDQYRVASSREQNMKTGTMFSFSV